MKLIIRGNKSFGYKFLGFAKQKLRIMKGIMEALGLDASRKFFKIPDASIDIEVASHYGSDSISICAIGAGENTCEFDEEDTCPIPCSNYELFCSNGGKDEESTFSPLEKRIRFRTLSPAPTSYWDTWLWSFGDDITSDNNIVVDHTYAKSGTYTTSLVVSKGNNVVSVGVAPDLSLSRFRSYRDNISNADSHANLLTTGWSTGVPIAARYLMSRPGGDWEYSQHEPTHVFDLTAVDPAATVWIQLEFSISGSPPAGIGIESSLGGQLTTDSIFPQTIDDITEYIGTSINVSFFDIGGAAILPDVGLNGWLGNDITGRVDTPDESLKTTKVIQVNKGKPTKTKQIGDAVHEVLI